MTRRRLTRQVGWLLLVGAAAAVAATSLYARQALAANTWSTTVTVSAVGQGAVMPIGQTPVAAINQGVISVSWAPSTFRSGKEVGGYILNRQVLGSTAIVQVCTVVAPLRTCQDSPPPQQEVMYTVIPLQAGWRGPASAPSAPMSLPVPVAPVTAAAPTTSPTASPSPAPSATPSPTITPTATPGPKPNPTPPSSPTPSPSPTGTASPTSTPAPTPS
jgi:hypothetical protein